MVDLFTGDMCQLRIAMLADRDAVTQALRALRQLGQVSLVHEPLFFEHLGVLDRSPLTVCAAREVQNDDVAVKVRVARAARRVLELSDDGGACELQPHDAVLRHARRDGCFDPSPCYGYPRSVAGDHPP